jgi:hypothetical protein
LAGDQPGFGVDVVGLGDGDGDGEPEFVVATPPILRNTAAQGSVGIYSGKTRTVRHTLVNDVAGVWFGAALANAGDTDGDGIDDLLVGGNFGAAPGLVRLYSGRSGEVLQAWSDPSPSSGFGAEVLGAGDLDRDGHADVVVTAMGSGREDLDQVFVFSGRSGRRIGVLRGGAPGAGFGAAVLPFCHRDGRQALAIGMFAGRHTNTGSFEFWQVGERGFDIFSELAAALHGMSACVTVPDTDGDGWPELFTVDVAGARCTVVRIASTQLRLGSARR